MLSSLLVDTSGKTLAEWYDLENGELATMSRAFLLSVLRSRRASLCGSCENLASGNCVARAVKNLEGPTGR